MNFVNTIFEVYASDAHPSVYNKYFIIDEEGKFNGPLSTTGLFEGIWEPRAAKRSSGRIETRRKPCSLHQRHLRQHQSIWQCRWHYGTEQEVEGKKHQILLGVLLRAFLRPTYWKRRARASSLHQCRIPEELGCRSHDHQKEHLHLPGKPHGVRRVPCGQTLGPSHVLEAFEFFALLTHGQHSEVGGNQQGWEQEEEPPHAQLADGVCGRSPWENLGEFQRGPHQREHEDRVQGRNPGCRVPCGHQEARHRPRHQLRAHQRPQREQLSHQDALPELQGIYTRWSFECLFVKGKGNRSWDFKIRSNQPEKVFPGVEKWYRKGENVEYLL